MNVPGGDEVLRQVDGLGSAADGDCSVLGALVAAVYLDVRSR